MCFIRYLFVINVKKMGRLNNISLNFKIKVDKETAFVEVPKEVKVFKNKPYSGMAIAKSKRNVTKMVVFTSLIFLFAYCIAPFISSVLVFKFNNKGNLLLVSLIANILQFGSFGFNMFVCYAFNNKYRSIFRKIILRKSSN